MIDVEKISLVGDDQEVGGIVATVPGGRSNLQDIYRLSPLQEGMLFHHLLNRDSDAYVLSTMFELRSDTEVSTLFGAICRVVERHDCLRTAVLWGKWEHPVQVVYRRVDVPFEEAVLEAAQDPLEQMRALMAQLRSFDLQRAPLIRFIVARTVVAGPRYALLQVHHLISDHQSLRELVAEALLLALRPERTLPQPIPYRDYVIEALTGAHPEEEEAFFRGKLADVTEPIAPFGLCDVHTSGAEIVDASCRLDDAVGRSVRDQARRCGVSPARLTHAAWALVLARVSGTEDVVFGTVVLARSRRRTGSMQALGVFVNTLPLRLRLSGLSAREFVEQTDRELQELLKFEHTSLTVAQRYSGVSGGAPLVTALFNFRHSAPSRDEAAADEMGIRVLARGEAWSNYPLALTVDDLGDEFTLTAQTDHRISALRVMKYLETALRSLTGALAVDNAQPVADLSIMPLEERRQLIEQFNATPALYPATQSVHEVFAKVAMRLPEAVAVSGEGESLTYSELNDRANRLGWYLQRRGVAVGACVPVLMSRSVQMLVVQLALLKCGAVYVPVDPDLPEERIGFMIDDCAARLLIVDGAKHARGYSVASESIDFSALSEQLAQQPASDPGVYVDAAAPAYVMYTSGSTGRPKGVIVPHRGINRLAINNGYGHFGPGDVFAHHSNTAFDASTFEIWVALLNGAHVVIVPQPVLLDANRFARLLVEQRVTTLYMSVGLFNQYTDALRDVFPRLRWLAIGGESLEPNAIRKVLRNCPPQQLLNVYGPTECTTFATRYVIHALADDATSVPIGSGIANTVIYITDSRLRLVPIGAVGEIHVGGAGVACGYLNRPQLTTERFVPDPFSGEAQARLYKTGDLGRWGEDGAIEYLGRNDQQVKIRGFRIELGEIESQLLLHECIKEAAVLAREDAPGDKQLVAYFVARDCAETLTIDTLRTYMKAVLPEYMVPSAFVGLDSLPLTSSGKVNRRQLPRPRGEAYAGRAYEAPVGEDEETLARIWQDVLHIEKIGRNYHFFEVGGNSLSVMRLVVRIADTFSVGFSVQAVFRNPTLKGMAREIEDARRAQSHEVKWDDDAPLDEGVL